MLTITEYPFCVGGTASQNRYLDGSGQIMSSSLQTGLNSNVPVPQHPSREFSSPGQIYLAKLVNTLSNT